MQRGTTQPTPRHRGGRGGTIKAHTRTTPHHREGGSNPQPHHTTPHHRGGRKATHHHITPQGGGVGRNHWGGGGGGGDGRTGIMYAYRLCMCRAGSCHMYSLLHAASFVRELLEPFVLPCTIFRSRILVVFILLACSCAAIAAATCHVGTESWHCSANMVHAWQLNESAGRWCKRRGPWHRRTGCRCKAADTETNLARLQARVHA